MAQSNRSLYSMCVFHLVACCLGSGDHVVTAASAAAHVWLSTDTPTLQLRRHDRVLLAAGERRRLGQAG